MNINQNNGDRTNLFAQEIMLKIGKRKNENILKQFMVYTKRWMKIVIN
jgi:hypothetical protein